MHATSSMTEDISCQINAVLVGSACVYGSDPFNLLFEEEGSNENPSLLETWKLNYEP